MKKLYIIQQVAGHNLSMIAFSCSNEGIYFDKMIENKRLLQDATIHALIIYFDDFF